MKDKALKYYPYIIFTLAGGILLIKCFFGFCWSDETFYFATADRFLRGDSIFKHDWFPTQLSGVVLLPFLAVFKLIRGSSDGVILYFRILFVIFSLINSVALFRILKQHVKEIYALVAAIMLLFYTHLNIATLSYYTISVQMFLMSMILIYHYYLTKSNKHLVISGILFAISVLALPTMAVAYFFVLIVIGILLLLNRFGLLGKGFGTSVKEATLGTVIKYTFLGILIPAIIFFIYMLLTVSINDFIEAIPYVLSDEEHGTSLIYPIKKFFIGINEVYGKSAYVNYILVVIAFLSSFFSKCKNHIFRYAVVIIDILLFILNFYHSIGHTGYSQTALLMFTLPVFFLLNKKDFSLFFPLIGGGMIFSLVYSYSSNGYLYILSMGHFIAGIAGILIIAQFIEEQEDSLTGAKIITLVMRLILITVLIETIALRIINIYRDAPLSQLDARINEGPAEGLYTTAAHLELYDNVITTLNKYCMKKNINDKDGSIFITKLLPFGYMCTDLKCAAPTTWRTGFDSVRLEPYYAINPDRYPDLILVLNKEYGTYDTCGDVEYDPCPNENEISGYLLDYVNSNDFTKITVPCGILYKKNIP